jgi:hypothetical protein
LLDDLIVVLVPALIVNDQERVTVRALDLDLDCPLAPYVLRVTDVHHVAHLHIVKPMNALLSHIPSLPLLVSPHPMEHLLCIPLGLDELTRAGTSMLDLGDYLLDDVVDGEATHQLLVPDHLVAQEAVLYV